MPTEYPPSRRRILLVEDDAPSRDLIARLVSLRPGAQLTYAVTGGTGIEAAVADPPDLILLDTRFADLSGLAVLRTLRTDPRTHFVPVVAVSADARPDHVRDILAAGADDYLTKPIDVNQLLAVIDRFAAP